MPLKGRSLEPGRTVVTRPRLLALLAATIVAAPLLAMLGVIEVQHRGLGASATIADALGFSAAALLALQVFTSGRWAATTRALGLARIMSRHRQVGWAVLGLVLAHIAIVVVVAPAKLALLDPVTAPDRARAGEAALGCLLVIGVTSGVRGQAGIGHDGWRVLHLLLGAGAIGGAFAHILLVDGYTAQPLVRFVVLGLLTGATAGLTWMRIVVPLLVGRRPYRLTELRREHGRAVTLHLEADDRLGMRFLPGQFARLRFDRGIRGAPDHPFSMSSAAPDGNTLEFTVKALGDLSGSLRDLSPPVDVYVDGPHGQGIDAGSGPGGHLLVVAGIGITPAMSLLRTAARGGDERPHLLVYGNRSWADVVFREELEDLRRSLPRLTVVHVLSRPEGDWSGARGHIDGELLRRVAPASLDGWAAFICGPPAMARDVRDALRALGVRPEAIQVEAFSSR